MRIIGGALGGRTIRAPKGDATRPTSEKVRGAIFNILGPLDDTDVLDLYAGSGAMAFESLSRGAKSAVLVDRAAPAIACCRANADELGLAAQIRVVQAPVLRALAKELAGATFDRVFVDPPYATDDAQAVLAAIPPLVREGGVVVIEHDKRRPPADAAGQLALRDRRRYGDTEVSFYR